MEAFSTYLHTLIAVAVLGGVINLFQFINFIKQSKLRFLSSRNPPLIIMYCIISLIGSFITTPIELYYHNLSDKSPPFAEFATEFFHEFCHCILYVIILCRSWLLYYDYKFSESSTNQIWRNVINPNDNNWWLKHKKTFGNLHFIVCVALIINSISLIALSFIAFIALKQENSNIFHFFTVFALGIPFYAFIIYLILCKINFINDIYCIHQELKYLSLCILIRIIAFIIDLIIYKYDNYLLFFSVEILSNFLSVWIQCQWVLNQLKKEEKKKYIEEYHHFDDSQEEKENKDKEIKSKNNKENKENKPLLKMVDIFDDKSSFQIFIKHCIHELSVESILWLIEVAQFKATLNKFNAFGIPFIKHRYLDVNNTNFVEYISQIRQQRIKIKHKMVSTPASFKLNNNTNPVSSDYNPPEHFVLHLNPSLLASESHTNTTNEPSKITSIRQESEYNQFQENILSKKWLPIAMPLKSLSNDGGNNSNIMSSKEISNNLTSEREKSEKSKSEKSKTKTKTNTNTNTNTTSSPKATVNSKLNANNFIAPISLAVINDNTYLSDSGNADSENADSENADSGNDDDNKDRKEDEKQDNKYNNNDNDERLTVDINWMYEYGRHLYLKYVDNSADLAINIPYNIRKNLWSVYSKELNLEAFQKIQLLHHEYLSEIGHLTCSEELLFIQSYLYHSFDVAFHSIWILLTSDTFHRFRKTKQYQMLCKQRDAQKLEDARIKRDEEYSQSFQGEKYNI